MIIVKRTHDSELINSVLRDPKVRLGISDDYSKNEIIEYPIDDAIYYIAAYYGAELAAMYVFIPQNSVTLQGHTAVLPRFWGEMSKELGRACINYIFTQTDFKKIVGCTPEVNKLAIKYNLELGFEKEGVNSKSLMKDGKLIDQIYFGLRADRWA